MGTINLADLTFPKSYDYYGTNLALRVWALLNESIRQWQSSGLLDENESFGVAVANPLFAGCFSDIWDSPTELVGFVVGWGPEGKRYVANAIRKVRATARTGMDTLVLAKHDTRQFRELVDSGSDNDYSWGDYPWGGAVLIDDNCGGQLVGVSGFSQEQDDLVARFVAAFLKHVIDGVNARV